MISLICVGALYKIVQQGMPVLDARFHYSPYEALGYLYHLSPGDVQRLNWLYTLDVLGIIPIYTLLLFKLAAKLPDWPRLSLQALAGMTAGADLVETSLLWLGAHGLGWESGWITGTASVATTAKWSLGALWLLVFSIARLYEFVTAPGESKY